MVWRPERHCLLAASVYLLALHKYAFPEVQWAAPAWLLQASLSGGKQKGAYLTTTAPFMELISEMIRSNKNCFSDIPNK